MADQTYVDEFHEISEQFLAWKPKRDSLIRRPNNWGDRDFADAAQAIDRLFRMVEDMAKLAVELIDDGNLSSMNQAVREVEALFKQIDGLDTAAMVNNRDNIALNLAAYFDQVRTVYKQEVAWLTLFSGGMENWITPAKEEYDRTAAIRLETEDHLRAAEQAASLAREKAGEAGATEFTAGYRQQAETAGDAAKRWLKATIGAFSVAFITAVIFITLHGWEIPAPPTTTAEALTYLGWRVGTVGLLVGAAVWCGRLFRAHKHNHEVNQHRAVCLENMRAFHAAVEDPAMKDLVALEFSRAATQGMPTGFISGRAEAKNDAMPHVLSVGAKQLPSAGPQSA